MTRWREGTHNGFIIRAVNRSIYSKMIISRSKLPGAGCLAPAFARYVLGEQPITA